MVAEIFYTSNCIKIITGLNQKVHNIFKKTILIKNLTSVSQFNTFLPQIKEIFGIYNFLFRYYKYIYI